MTIVGQSRPASLRRARSKTYESGTGRNVRSLGRMRQVNCILCREPLPRWDWRAAIRASSGSGSDVVAVGGQREVDVASGGVRVGAYLIGGGNDPSGLLGIVNLRQGHGELDG